MADMGSIWDVVVAAGLTCCQVKLSGVGVNSVIQSIISAYKEKYARLILALY